MKITKEVEVGLEKGHIQVISEGMTGVKVDQGPDQEQVLTETRLGVTSVEYDHFAKDCQTMAREERKTEQVQQMLNLDEEQTVLKALATDTYDKS